jgi:hypothetical protein
MAGGCRRTHQAHLHFWFALSGGDGANNRYREESAPASALSSRGSRVFETFGGAAQAAFGLLAAHEVY